MKRVLPTAVCLVLATAQMAKAAVDGVLNESEWQTANRIDDWVSVLPATYASDAYTTELRWFTAQDGLHIGFTNTLPATAQSRLRHARDKASALNDQNSVLIDFANDGTQAYQFTVSNGGSIHDATVDREGLRNTDWDGQWQAATHNNEQGWTSEFLIPWNVVPMPAATQEHQWRWYFHRFDAQRGVHLASERFYWAGTDVLARLPTIAVPLPRDSTRFDFAPYVTQQWDRFRDEQKTRAGFDLFWQPDTAHLLSASVNPDFGQVESDELVVNFSATETLTSEKRPFFSENQGLFSLNGARGMRLIHTRRIGAAPDRGSEGATELLGAAKYSFQSSTVDLATLYAREENSRDAEGREYAMLRNIIKQPTWKLGWLVTDVDRPTIERQARVYAVDANADFSDVLRLEAMVLRSNITQADDDTRGEGYSTRWFWRPSEQWRHRLHYSHLDASLDVRDFGYIGRVNNRQFFLDSTYTDSDFSPDNFTQSRTWRLWYSIDRFANGQRMPSVASITLENTFRSNAWLSFESEFWSDGYDDWSSNFNRIFRREAAVDIWSSARSTALGNWRFEGEWNRYHTASVDGFLHQYIVRPIYTINEQSSLKFELQHVSADDWLIWRNQQLRSYDRTQWQLGLELHNQITEQQEWRIKWQWYALHAKGRNNFTVLDERLHNESDNTDHFNNVKLALQIRYLYHVSKQTDLYVIYSRGGIRDAERDSDDHQWQQDWQDGWQNRSEDNVMVKWRVIF